MTARFFLSFVLLLASTVAPSRTASASTELPVKETEPELYFAMWDDAQQRLLFYRDVIGDQAAVKAFENGELRTSIYPLRAFPGAKAMNIWAVTPLPEGGIAISGVLDFGNENTKLVILTYSKEGALKRLWDMQVRHTVAITADEQGNIYAFGLPVDVADTPQSNYMMLAKFSPSGQLLKEFLPRSRFSSLLEATSIDPRNGESKLTLSSSNLVLYLANAKQALWFDRDGALLKTVDFGASLDDVTAINKSESAEVYRFFICPDGSYIIQVRLWPATAALTESSDPVVIAIEVSADGKKWQRIGTTLQLPGTLVGVTSQKQFVILQLSKGKLPTLSKYDRMP